MGNLQLCDECAFAAMYDDYTALDYHYDANEADERMKAIKAGLETLGWITPDFGDDGVEEHSMDRCDCCGTNLHGKRYRFEAAA